VEGRVRRHPVAVRGGRLGLDAAHPDGAGGHHPALTDPQKIRDAVREQLEKIDGVSGNLAVYSMTPDRHGPTGIEGLAIIKLHGGKFVLERAY
jgi:hypothetical protein